MRVAELSRRSGVSVASIKYYLREGLLPPGELTSPNQAHYDEEHLRRLRLVRALLDVGGLTVEDDASVRAEKVVADLVARRGWRVTENNAGRRAAIDVLATLDRLGGDQVVGLLDVYAEAMEAVGDREVAAVVDRDEREGSVERVVVGVVLGGALIAALRGMAEESASARRVGPGEER